MMDRTQQDAIYRSVARRFLAWVDGDPHYDKFWPWLQRPEQHEMMHAFMAAGRVRGDAEGNAMVFCQVLTEEHNARLVEQAGQKSDEIGHALERRRAAGASNVELSAFAYDAWGALGLSREEIDEFLTEWLAEGA